MRTRPRSSEAGDDLLSASEHARTAGSAVGTQRIEVLTRQVVGR